MRRPEKPWYSATLAAPEDWHHSPYPTRRDAANAKAGTTIHVRPTRAADTCGCTLYEVHPEDARNLDPRSAHRYVTECMLKKRGPTEGDKQATPDATNAEEKQAPGVPRHRRHQRDPKEEQQ